MSVQRGGGKLAIRIAVLTLLGGALTVVGLLIATAAASPPKIRGCWFAYAPLAKSASTSCFGAAHSGTVTDTGEAAAYRSSVVFHPYPVTAWWVVLLLVVGLGALWAGCAWLLLQPPKGQPPVDTTSI